MSAIRDGTGAAGTGNGGNGTGAAGAGGGGFEIAIVDRLSRIGAAEWDGCACPETADGGPPFDPFTTYAFLSALEDSGSVGPGTGWLPRHLTVRAGGRLIACAPMYLKSHSRGEYVFDHAWADAWERAGGRYYPKLQMAVPFTPVTGRRLLVRPGHERAGRAALLRAAVELAGAGGLSSLHVTFCTGDEVAAGTELGLGLMHRIGRQFHWHNRGYGDFGDFLAALSSRKRKTLRRERARANAFGGTIRLYSGAALRPAHWDAFWAFYQDTGARKWGTPYLTRAFFDLVHERMGDHIALFLAERDGRPVAGALNFVGREALFGRYWGCIEHHPFLHFELCYHRAVELAIERGLKRVEAGAQGEHKLARGYLPVRTHSLHWIADPGFAEAVAGYLRAEAGAVGEEIGLLAGHGPFRKVDVEEGQ